MDELKHNQELIRAVEDLYNNKIIRKDKDIADKTGYSKSTVSGYISGKVMASEDFLKEFENKFEIRLANYRTPAPTAGDDPPPAFVPIPWQEYLQLIHLSLEALKAGQNEILLQQAKTRAEVRGYGKYQLVKDAKGRSETFERLLLEVDKLVNGELTQDDAQDNPPGS